MRKQHYCYMMGALDFLVMIRVHCCITLGWRSTVGVIFIFQHQLSHCITCNWFISLRLVLVHPSLWLAYAAAGGFTSEMYTLKLGFISCCCAAYILNCSTHLFQGVVPRYKLRRPSMCERAYRNPSMWRMNLMQGASMASEQSKHCFYVIKCCVFDALHNFR